MRALIAGYGRMGKEVERALVARGHAVAARVDPHEAADARALSADLVRGADVVIDFSHPSGVWDNIRLYIEAGVPAVIGTTGWEAHREEARQLCLERKGALLWGNNFSIGAHLFFHLAGEAARLIRNLPDYDIGVWECHHNKKADSPSGTALTTAERILRNLDRKSRILTTPPEGPIAPEALHVASVRVGSEPGLHEVVLDSPQDQITLRHHARGRQGFAVGAVAAAEWLLGRTGFYQVEDFIQDRYFSPKKE